MAHRVCRNKNWNMNALDNLIFDEIRKLSFEEITPVPKDDDHAKLIQSKIDDLDGQIKRLMDLYSVGGVPLDLLHEKIQTVTDQRSALEEDLERTKKEHRLSMGDALDLSASLDAVLLSGDFDEIRAVICGLIDKIVIDGDDVSIHWNFE